MESAVTKLYRLRFEKELRQRNKIWQVLCKDFFQKYINKSSTVCDLGAGFCEFINNIDAKHKIAIDINPQTKKYAAGDVNVAICSSVKIPAKFFNEVDVVFASNFFEHLPSKGELTETLIVIKKVLKVGGKVIILMPNIRYVGPSYWDFLDHQLPLTEKSMVEALELYGFKILEKRIKFLPYSTKGSLPKAQVFVRLYLKLPFLHQIFGKQSLIVAAKVL